MTEKVRSNDGSESRKAKAAALLASGCTVNDTAKRIRIAAKTLWRWRRSPKFQRRVSRLRAQMIDAVYGQLAASGLKAAKKLDSLIDDADVTIAGANAKALIDRLLKAREAVDIEARLTALELEQK